MRTVTIRKWEDLQQFGINCLTGESCAYGLRLLCDLNEKGAKLLSEYFCIPNKFAENWNSTVNGEKAIGSILLPRYLLKELATFIMVHVKHFKYYVDNPNEVIGFDDEEFAEFAREEKYRLFENHTLPHSEGGRCIHQFSGRVK